MTLRIILLKEINMDYYNEIKKQLLNNEINRIVKDYSKNKNDLTTYYNVGKLLTEFQNKRQIDKNNNIINEISTKLTNEIGKGYSVTNLKYMMKFYLYFKEEKGNFPTQLNWSHYIELLSLNNIDEINYYIHISLKENLSYRELHRKIRNKEYQNTKKEFQTPNEINNKSIPYYLNKIKLDNKSDIKITLEKQLIIESLSNIMKILDNNYCYCYIDSKYKIDNNNYIDLLLYNIELNCYTVINLITSPIKPKDITQIKEHINYIDKSKKKTNQNNTIGIILLERNNELSLEYISDKRISKEDICIK